MEAKIDKPRLSINNQMSSTRSKILTIELDGATWDVINPLLSNGKLPNLANLIRKGAAGTLMSDPPLLSPRLWVSIFSGKKSQEHGIEFFGSSSTMVKTKRIWDICSDKGFTVGVFGSFVTWPPYPVNGFMIPSIFSLGTETYPSGYQFLQELTLGERKKNRNGKEPFFLWGSKLVSMANYAYLLKKHGVRVRTFFDGTLLSINNLIKRSQEERYWKKGGMHLRICSDIFSSLYRRYRPEYSTFHIHLCDALSHRYWKYYEPEKFWKVDTKLVERYRNVIPNAYIEADRVLGQFISMIDSETTIIVLSDHGSAALQINRESYKLQTDVFLRLLKIEKSVIPANVGFMTFLYFNDKALMESISNTVGEMRFLDNGQKLFDVFYEESLIGIRLTEKLWGSAIPSERLIDMGTLGRHTFSSLFSPHRMDVSGDHKLEGILVVSGPGIKKGYSIPNAGIYDITPTSLAIMGLPVARDMNGNVLQDIFDSPLNMSYIESYDSTHTQKEDDDIVDVDKVKERLKTLGYL